MKLSEYDEVISAYKTYVLDFFISVSLVRSFLRPSHYKSMGKKKINSVIFTLAQAYLSVIISYMTVVDN